MVCGLVPNYWERRGENVVRHFMTGFLQEAFYSMSDGKIFDVGEEACVAQSNPACIIKIKLIR